MDSRRFDALTRAFSATRRGTLAALVVGALSPFVPASLLEAKKKKHKKKKRCKVNCAGRDCGPSNCKGVSCGSCTGNSRCSQSGTCVGCLSADDCARGQVCTEQQVCCTPSCDGRHCASDGCGGRCACADGTICEDNACVCPTAGQVLCGGACITAECCAPNEQPGMQCGNACLDGVTCCPSGRGCTQTEDCCGFDREHPADRAVCQDNQCCQPLGAICGGQSTTCCQGTCKQGFCDACEPDTCCTNHLPGCSAGQKCCGTTCIDRLECCTDGVRGSCPSPTRCNPNSGECVLCLSDHDCPTSSACVTWSCRGDGSCGSSLADNGASCGGTSLCRDGQCIPRPTCGVRFDPCTEDSQCCSGVCLSGGIGGGGARTCQAPAIGDPCLNIADCFPNACEAYICVASS